jgi:hypothetical protein
VENDWVIGFWLSAAGYRLLAVRFPLQAFGCPLSAAGFWLSAFRCRLLDLLICKKTLDRFGRAFFLWDVSMW